MAIHHGIKQFTRIDDWWSALIILGDYAAVVTIATIAIFLHSSLATFVAIVLIAGRQIAFLNLVHAAAHRSLFSKRRTNDNVDAIVGFPIFDAVVPYRSYHLEHHREIARKAPERFDYLKEQVPKPGVPLRQRVWIMVVKPLLGAAGLDFIRATIDQCSENRGMTRKLIAYWIVVIVIFYWMGWLRFLLVYWILPLVWLYPVFYFWAEVSDHHAVKEDARNQRGIFYSIFIKSHEMYHAVHHRYPRIPFYRVRAAYKYLDSVGEKMEETKGVVDFVSILHRNPNW